MAGFLCPFERWIFLSKVEIECNLGRARGGAGMGAGKTCWTSTMRLWSHGRERCELGLRLLSTLYTVAYRAPDIRRRGFTSRWISDHSGVHVDQRAHGGVPFQTSSGQRTSLSRP